jgi:hypothetical protein
MYRFPSAENVLVSAVLVKGSRRGYGRLNMLRRTWDANVAVDLRTLQRGRVGTRPDRSTDICAAR